MKQVRLRGVPSPDDGRRGQLELFDPDPEPARRRRTLARCDLDEGIEMVKRFTHAARAESTHRTYAREWRLFAGRCEEKKLVSLPAAGLTVAMYLAELAARRRVGGIAVALAAICSEHRAAGASSPLDDETVLGTWRGIRRRLGIAPHQKAPLLVASLRKAVASLPTSTVGLRDRAILLLGWAGAFRRSELVALQVEDVREVTEGLVVLVRHSKTDQEGEGRTLGVPRGKHGACPVAAVTCWIDRARIAAGPLFRGIDRWGHLRQTAVSPHHVAKVVKRAATAAGLDPREFSGHSLRAGYTTVAADAGMTERQIMEQTGHGSGAMVRRYIRGARLFKNKADLGL